MPLTGINSGDVPQLRGQSNPLLCLGVRVTPEHQHMGFRQLVSELRRRGVVRAGGIYLAAGWLLVQVLDVATDPMGLPAWTLSLVLWLFVIAFPLMLAFSWRYDVGLDGIRRTPPAREFEPRELGLRKGDLAGLAIGALLIAALAVYLAGLMQSRHAEIVDSVSAPPVAAANSIAVLPFENLGGDEQNYLGQGLAEDILHRLAAIPDMRVASRTAAFDLDTRNMEISEIGRRLGVRNLLEGSVRREGDRVRVVVQLIDTQTGYHRFSTRFDRQIQDLFAIYDEISTAVTTELQLTLAPETPLVKAPPTRNMVAYDYFLQARSMLHRASQPLNVANAQAFFAKAVAADPDFAEAWAGECRAWLEWHTFEPSADKIEAAEKSCRRSVDLDPSLAEGHVALGDLYRTTGAYEQSVPEYQQAIRSNPNLAIAWRGLGQALDATDRDQEAEGALIRATEIDPDDLLNWYTLGDNYFKHGAYAKALPVYEKMAQHPRAGASAFNAVGAARYMLGDFEGAAQAYRKVLAVEPTGVAYANVGIMYYLTGRFDDSVVMLREALTLEPDNPEDWATLGDSLRQTPGGAGEAREAYTRAVSLGESLLAVNPRDTDTLTLLAHGEACLGDDQKAMLYLATALDNAPDDPYVYYYAALVHLAAGRDDAAIKAIQRALQLNYPVALLRRDPQFDKLRSNPGFAALLADSGPTGGE